MVVETLCPACAFRKGRGVRTSVRSKFGWQREARKDVASSKTAAPSAPSFVPMLGIFRSVVEFRLGHCMAHRIGPDGLLQFRDQHSLLPPTSDCSDARVTAY
jgi:hypothetical protein